MIPSYNDMIWYYHMMPSNHTIIRYYHMIPSQDTTIWCHQLIPSYVTTILPSYVTIICYHYMIPPHDIMINHHMTPSYDTIICYPYIIFTYFSFCPTNFSLKHMFTFRSRLENTEPLLKERQTQLLTCGRLLLDMSYAIAYLPPGILWGGKFQTWQIGALGTISSLIGLHQALEKRRIRLKSQWSSHPSILFADKFYNKYFWNKIPGQFFRASLSWNFPTMHDVTNERLGANQTRLFRNVVSSEMQNHHVVQGVPSAGS